VNQVVIQCQRPEQLDDVVSIRDLEVALHNRPDLIDRLGLSHCSHMVENRSGDVFVSEWLSGHIVDSAFVVNA
jgi:hypothetical protein